MDLYQINKSGKSGNHYLVHDLLYQVEHSFFQIQNLQLLIFCMDGQELLVILDYVPLCFLWQRN